MSGAESVELVAAATDLVPAERPAPTPAEYPGMDVVASAVAALAAKWEYARVLARASLIPDTLKVGRDAEATAANVFLVLEYGGQLNLHPTTALSHIHIVKGKPGASGQLMRVKIREAGHRLDFVETTDQVARIQIIPKGMEPDRCPVWTFTLADAERAGLCKIVNGKAQARSAKNEVKPWESYTETMLLERAISKGMRMMCPEVMMGVSYTHEELEAMTDGATAEEITHTPEREPEPQPCTVGYVKGELLKALGGPDHRDEATAAWAYGQGGNLIPDSFTVEGTPSLVGKLINGATASGVLDALKANPGMAEQAAEAGHDGTAPLPADEPLPESRRVILVEQGSRLDSLGPNWSADFVGAYVEQYRPKGQLPTDWADAMAAVPFGGQHDAWIIKTVDDLERLADEQMAETAGAESQAREEQEAEQEYAPDDDGRPFE